MFALGVLGIVGGLIAFLLTNGLPPWWPRRHTARMVATAETQTDIREK